MKYQINQKFFNLYWNNEVESLQIIGKEIIRFHLIYWLLLLKQLNLPLPKNILIHGWIINNNIKMSKSKNNSINPYELIKIYDVDALRYFLITCFQIKSDNNYSAKVINDYYNSTLVNSFGNLISRVFKMIIKYFDSKIINTDLEINNFNNDYLIKKCQATISKYVLFMDNYDCYHANLEVLELLKEANKLIEIKKPWAIENKNILKQFLSSLFFVIIVSGFLFKPFFIKNIKILFKATNFEIEKINFFKKFDLRLLKEIEIKKYLILFKRIKLG